MKRIPFSNITVFALFFGVALLEAFQEQNWLGALLFLALGVMSFFADFSKR